MRRKINLAVWLSAVLGLLVAPPGGVAAQGVTTAAVRGTVTSAQGQPLENVQVVVRNSATGFTRTARTSAAGQYNIPNLPPGGPYVVSASQVGFEAVQQGGINLVLSQTTTVDLRLAPQAVTIEGLTVTAEANPVISPSRTGASTVIGERDIENIPSLDRNFTNLAIVSPHVSVTGGSASIGGANNRFNNIQIDGAVNNDVFGLAASGVPGGQANAKPISIAAIQQFQVLVAPFDVRQTGFTGGLINAVTRSGTNRFRGEVYGFFRNEALTRRGELIGAERLQPISDFQRAQGGFSLGGPIVRDRLFFFVNGEFEQRRTPLEFGLESDPAQIGVLPERVQSVIAAAERQGLNPGGAGTQNLENPITNLFGRLDFTLSDTHRMVLRHNFVAANDQSGLRRSGGTFTLGSNQFQFTDRTNSTVMQLFSQFSDDTSNELLANVQWIRDRRAPDPPFRFSQVDVFTRDVIGGRSTRGTIRLGAEYFSQANELDQDIVEVTDNLTLNRGRHRFTLGLTGQYLRFRNLFFPGSLGYYRFDSPDLFAAGRPSYYEINLPFPGRDDPAARFSVLQPGGYVQDEWSPGDNLTVTLGLRADVPLMLDEPVENPDFLAAFGRSTGQLPSGNVLFSPRLGFNWRSDELSATQIRGGVGIFSGRPPYVWISNAFGNTGRETALLVCRGNDVPRFDPTSPPRTCAGGQGPAASGGSIINLIDEEFRWPQDLKFDLAIDRELPLGLTGTVEGILTKAVNQIYVRELNLRHRESGVDVPASAKQGIGDRLVYGPPINNRDAGFDPVRVAPRFRNVVEMTNNAEGYAYSLTGELRRTFLERFNLRGSYTFSRVRDVQSLTSSIATSNYGFNAVGRSIEDRPVTRSEFDVPHKVVVQATADDLFRRFGGTSVSMVYVGSSGRPYSYTYNGDVNGDGYEGPGIFGRNNDLIYVPRDLGEVRFASADDARLFGELLAAEECLSSQAGSILARNSCRGPWSNLVNVQLQQGLPVAGGRGPKIQLEIFNFLNLLNREWGLQEGPFNATVNALELRGRSDPRNPSSPMVFSYNGATTRDEAGVLHARRPLSTFFSSRYQVQLGLRYDF